MLCPFQKIIIKLDIFGHQVTRDTETATIKEILGECSTNCASWNKTRGICMLCYKSKS